MTGLTRRILAAGVVAAIVAGATGWLLERQRFGATDTAALAGIEAEVRQRFDRSVDMLGDLAAAVAADRDALRAAPRDQAATRQLFDTVDRVLASAAPGRTGVTVYDPAGNPVAWGGRVSDLPRGRIDGPAVLFVAPGALGPRLVRVEPIAGDRPNAPRLATVVAEQTLGEPERDGGIADTFVLQTSIAPVSLRTRVGAVDLGAREAGVDTFVITSRGGGALVDATVARADIQAARARWQRITRSVVLSILAITLLLCAAPLLDIRARARTGRMYSASFAALVATVVGARLILWFAFGADLLLTAAAAAAIVWLLVDAVERVRVLRPRVLAWTPSTVARLVVVFGLAGVAAGALVAGYEEFLRGVVDRATLDVLHFSLHPINASRLAIAFALVLLHATVIWLAALIAVAATALARTGRGMAPAAGRIGAWLIGVVSVAEAVARASDGVPPGPLVIATAAAGAAALAMIRFRTRARRASQAVRLGTFFVALLVPAIAMYPSLVADASSAKERLVAAQFGPQVISQRDELQDRLRRALEQIDAMPGLADFVRPAPLDLSSTDRAFAVWSETDLASHRLTSAVELYGPEAQLVSRFALNLPEYTTSSPTTSNCEWNLYDEVSPFGSSERHVLRASRGVCAGGRSVGAIVVRVMFDYRTLPFISAQSPYLESLRAVDATPAEVAPGRDVEFVVYGWSRAPIFASGTAVWPLPDRAFSRMVASRARFWATIQRDGGWYRVYFLNDRGGIYALGYPMLTAFGHVVNLAELITLAGVLYVLLVVAATVFNMATARAPAGGRAVWREIRSSFYRKLLGAFVITAVAPVVILAFATRTYFATQFRAGIDEAAVRTATVAQRLVEDYATLQQRGGAALDTIDDQIMVLVSRAIDQDVNLFDRARLQATSERDLFASGLLTTRTPGDVYRQIVLDRLPTFVADEQVGDAQYLIAAAPVRTGAGDRAGIVTVPLTFRQREIERQIDELDRRVLFAAVLFSLLGAALGYWMAERIADPVNRLTRATERIARGDLDARITATSSDELRTLVEDFNRMAEDLKRQRADLERTQRLEAWAEMARQVAHDIKNPLTPIQLSAEHAMRVNVDRGRPLSPVLDNCVNAILTQVRLLRQLSAEFSSFASSPTPRPEPTDVGAISEEVLEPYRAALAGRVDIVATTEPALPMLWVDRTLLARALTNVIENALHAMPGGGTLTVMSRQSSGPPTKDGGSAVVMTITDTGVGMGEEDVEKIFEPYFSTKATGTGLGLTIARRNVELNGGTIRVESKRGVGTTVTIVLPTSAARTT